MSADFRSQRPMVAVALLSLSVGCFAQFNPLDQAKEWGMIWDREPARWLDNPLNVPVWRSGEARTRLSMVLPECGAVPAAEDLWSLQAAMEQALCHRPQLQQSRAGILVQAAALGEARAAWLPTLNTTINRLHSHTAYPDAQLPDNSVTGQSRYANLNWRLYNFGAREAHQASAELLLEAARSGHDAHVYSVLSEVVQTWFDAQISESAWRVRQLGEDWAAQTLQSTRQREQRGVASVGEVMQAQAAWARARLASQRAQADRRKAQANLAHAIGLSPAQLLRLPTAQAPGAAQALEALSSWLNQASENHPALRAAKAQWDAAQADVQAVKAEGLPSLDFTWSQARNGYPNQGLSSMGSRISTYGVSLSIPLFEGFARSYKVQGAQARSEDAQAKWQEASLQVSLDIVRAHAEALAALDNLSSSETLLQAAEASRESAQRRHQRGAADILEWINAQTAAADARLERERCLSEWDSARWRLLAAAGRLEPVKKD